MIGVSHTITIESSALSAVRRVLVQNWTEIGSVMRPRRQTKLDCVSGPVSSQSDHLMDRSSSKRRPEYCALHSPKHQ